MPVLDQIKSFHPEMTDWRRDFHAHPEIGFEEERTSAIVAQKLESFGIEVHRGLGDATGELLELDAVELPHMHPRLPRRLQAELPAPATRPRRAPAPVSSWAPAARNRTRAASSTRRTSR